MISATAGELADLLEDDRRESFRVRVADHTDTLQDVSAQVLSLDVTIDVNQPSRSANVVMQLGTNSVFTSNPTVYPRRRVVIDMEVRKHDEALGSGWVEVFNGYTTVPKLNARQDMIALPCQDRWLDLYNQLIRTEGTYGSSGGTAIETVLQSLETDNLNTYTISVSGTPSTSIYTYTQRRMRLSQALVDVANVNGWDLRFYGTTLTFQEPPRSKTTPDYTFDTDGFFDVPYAALNPDGIVNTVDVQWDDSNTETGADSTSVTNWGELAVYVDARQDPQFYDATTAQALADIIVTDRANPLTEWQVKGRLFPFAEIWDLYRFPALTQITSGNTDLAVSKVVHSFPGFGQMPHTMLYLSGSPSGGVDRWDRLITKTEVTQIVTDVTGAIPVNTDTIIPTVEVKTSQSSGTGTVTLVVNDPDSLVNATSFESFTGGGDFDASTDPTGWSGYDNSDPYGLTDSVSLSEAHTSFIAWAVRYDSGAGNVWIRNIVTFDADSIPNFVCGLHLDGTAVYLSQTGDEDFASLTYADSKSSMPADATADSGTVINGRTTDGTQIETSMSDGDTLYVKATGWSSTGGTGTQSATYWRGQIGYSASATPRPPVVQVQTDQNGSTGTLALTISDPDSVVNATSFESSSGSGDYDFSTDPATWNDYDNAAPYGTTDTVTISSKHISKIAWAVRYDLGEGAGNEWIQGESTFDSDNIAEIAGVMLGFDDDGIPLVTMVGDEDSVGCVCSIKAGSAPNAPVVLGTSTLSADEAAGQTVLSVNSVTGAVAGEYGYISDGTNAEVFYISSVGASSITIGSALLNSYVSGDTIKYFDYTGGTTNEYGGGVLSQSGTVKMEAASTGPEQTLNIDMGEEVYLIARAVGVNGLGPATGTIRRRRGDTQYILPRVVVQATRSGTSVSVDFTITDPSLAISSNPSYKRRDSSDQTFDGSWQTSWNTSTGTAGAAQSLVRKVTLADPYSAMIWRVQYTDENGNSREIGDEIDFASVVEISKTMVVSPADFVPATSSENYGFSTSAGNRGLRVYNQAADNLEMIAGLVLPTGVELTNITAYQYEVSGNVATMYLRQSSTLLATISATGTGSDSASLSHTVVDTALYYLLFIGQNSAFDKTGVDYVEIDYNIPSFVQAY